jgi:hypothetical protein
MRRTDSLFPILTVKRSQVEFLEVDSVNASEVHIDFVRIGARRVERMDASISAELVLRNSCIESV